MDPIPITHLTEQLEEFLKPVDGIELHGPEDALDAFAARARTLENLLGAVDSMWEPGRWWSVVDPDGGIYLQTSDEEEARDVLKEQGEGFTLEREWVIRESVRRPVLKESDEALAALERMKPVPPPWRGGPHG